MLYLTNTNNFIIFFKFTEIVHFSHNNKETQGKTDTQQQLHSYETRNGRPKAQHFCECARQCCYETTQEFPVLEHPCFMNTEINSTSRVFYYIKSWYQATKLRVFSSSNINRNSILRSEWEASTGLGQRTQPHSHTHSKYSDR